MNDKLIRKDKSELENKPKSFHFLGKAFGFLFLKMAKAKGLALFSLYVYIVGRIKLTMKPSSPCLK